MENALQQFVLAALENWQNINNPPQGNIAQQAVAFAEYLANTAPASMAADDDFEE